MFRYCITRQSYAVWTAIQVIDVCWDDLSYTVQSNIQKEILFAIDRGILTSIDKEAWNRILELPLKEDPIKQKLNNCNK